MNSNIQFTIFEKISLLYLKILICFHHKMISNIKLLMMIIASIYFLIQLIIIQVYIKNNKFNEDISYQQSITILNVLLLIDSCSFFILMNMLKKSKDNWIVYYDSILFGLLISWLIMAIPYILMLESFYIINIVISFILFFYNIWVFKFQHGNKRTSSTSLSILELSKIFKSNKRKTSFSDYNKLQRDRCNSSEPEEISNDHPNNNNMIMIHDDHEHNFNTIETSRTTTATIIPSQDTLSMIKYMPRDLDITKKGICEGFRINLNLLSNPDPTIPSDLDWDIFQDLEHVVDSSSCHIYTAKWENKTVILKLIKEERLSSPVAVAEFDIEEAVLSRISHPNIVKLLGSGKKPRKYLVLEYLSGGTLSQSLGIRGDKQRWTKKFSMLDTLQLAYGLSKALHYLHNEWSDAIDIIHRDLKPDNIGWSNDGILKLFDFGLCVVIRSQRDPTEQYRMTGNTGTLRYMAPEVVLGRSYHKSVDRRSYHKSVDSYSFGILIWQVATGKIPYQEMGKKAYFDKVVIGGQRPKLYTYWPKGFCELLISCWNEDKNLRPGFEEIMIELSILLQEENEKLQQAKSYSYYLDWIIHILKPILFIISLILFILSFVYTYKYNSQAKSWAVVGGIVGIGLYLISMSYIGIITHLHSRVTTSPGSIYQQTFLTENQNTATLESKQKEW